jgi:hypothetical protein
MNTTQKGIVDQPAALGDAGGPQECRATPRHLARLSRDLRRLYLLGILKTGLLRTRLLPHRGMTVAGRRLRTLPSGAE